MNRTAAELIDIQEHKTCRDPMALSDIFPIFIVAGALWVLVYCILMTQKIFMESHYQEIQPKPEEEPAPNAENEHEEENHKHDHTERTFFAYYL